MKPERHTSESVGEYIARLVAHAQHERRALDLRKRYGRPMTPETRRLEARKLGEPVDD
jgi:hypothetical protein